MTIGRIQSGPVIFHYFIIPDDSHFDKCYKHQIDDTRFCSLNCNEEEEGEHNFCGQDVVAAELEEPPLADEVKDEADEHAGRERKKDRVKEHVKFHMTMLNAKDQRERGQGQGVRDKDGCVDGGTDHPEK